MDDARSLLIDTEPILRQYAIEPYFVENFGRTKKVYANSGQYALKKIDARRGTDFIRNTQFLFQKGFNRIVPVYPAADGRYAVLEKDSLYYLMPWLPNEVKENRTERPLQLFRELARLHTLSARDVEVGRAEREKHYEQTAKQWEKDEEFIDGFIEASENEWYMSPFQMLFCLYYQDIRQAMQFARQKLDSWKEKTAGQSKARMVMLHGKVSSDHFLFDERGFGYFINFEDSRLGSPIKDLLPFFSRYLRARPKQADEGIEWLNMYFKHFPFREDEKLLFVSYMAYPTGILKAVQSYHLTREGQDELRAVQKFQKLYWQLKNTEYVVMRMEEIEKQKEEAAASQQGAQS
ncbi:spore coat protein YsxE [Mesobacillus zeae]|uniref:Spore coat protein YsxE n=1 Tax=Mesobacillus zeae TaxID=1917180 RepID=A0A398B091_9BACI|nr:spore coat protein YsxE [Mesobacillus zeae]RID83257.1 spore coat protein YsxE [Mesobacillus zeae]